MYAYTHYPDDQRNNEHRSYPYHQIQSLPQSNNYYAFNPTQAFPTPEPQAAGHQPYPTHDPRLSVQRTNQTLSALASARRVPPEYIMQDQRVLSQPSRSYSHQVPSYEPPQTPQYKGYGEPLESSYGYGMRPTQPPKVAASPPAAMGASQKTTDGHACSYCGKAFGRPSALKYVDMGMATSEDVARDVERSEWQSFGEGKGTAARLPEAVTGIEDLICSFLSQLSSFGRTSRSRLASDIEVDTEISEDSETTSNCHRQKAKIDLQLVDRSKHATSGDVPLFKSQRTVDSLVDDLAATLELERSDLNIRASSKGLISGSGLVINLHTGEELRANDTEGTLIPVGEDIKSFSIDPLVAWVLIVEKEAVFQTLCRLKLTFHASLPRGLMITGKGYPDVATRHLLKTLGDVLPTRIPMLALVDCDPYGLDILSVYKFGSRSLQHENSKLAADRIVWLGVSSSELAT
ncbi:hypothetical protein DXG01_016711 [Tephrocybe rancida]|nr:hypothetical protein DXG01_016711 [Tephrocybe rancida]